ncbi:1359_t:CDS:2 [Dentiscutata erythropus]|uniref:1359_t:CDS:1 n=1 Tax=Dentiscutata erythropus TaxID=1348616 RepID=A0A9N8WE53_9GLOM|nr:1359_t:CDS:2 [Dentiscutata erythropus]
MSSVISEKPSILSEWFMKKYRFINDKQEDSPEGYSWQPPSEMHNLPTKIFKDNLLTLNKRKSILQVHPCNKHIFFKPPTMNKGLWKYMPKNIRDNDKSFAKISYHISATIHPLDNFLHLLYDSKPDDSDNETLERNEAIKYISPLYQLASEQEEIFSPTELKETLEKENTKNKICSQCFSLPKTSKF